MVKSVISQIEPVNETELISDLKFLYHNRSDNIDQFVDEAVDVFKNHVNDVMVRYQENFLQDMTEYMRGEIVNVILRSRKTATYKEDSNDRARDW